ncbi:MAG: glycosyltransferase family 1 protein [Patescibacteria group bacterium]|nr:glycosyltransferase family 1 protein [Patescibacteria group bacterium]
MHIGIDARFFGPEGKGLGRYTEKLVKNLEIIDSLNQYTIFLREENWDYYQPKNPRFRKIKAPFRWYSLKEQVSFPRLIKAQKLDLMHFPHFNVPLFYYQPFIVTIHDLIITHFPTTRATTLGPARYLLKRLGYQWVISSAVKRSRKVITVSEYTKRELVSYFRLNPDKVAVTYEAAEPFSATPTPAQDVLAKYKINEPYILYVGNAYPHKNLELLLEAFAELKERFPELKLVLVGRLDYFYGRLKNKSELMGFASRVVFPGYIPDEDLPGLYQKAMLYVFPSLAEGFGLPPLEAMQYGLPVVASSASCLPEVLGRGAAYFDPKSKHAIVKVLSDLINDSPARDNLRQLGYRQVKTYRWPKMAEQTLALYEQQK